MSIFHKSSLSLDSRLLRCLFQDVLKRVTQQTDVFKRSALKWLVQITPGAQNSIQIPALFVKEAQRSLDKTAIMILDPKVIHNE